MGQYYSVVLKQYDKVLTNSIKVEDCGYIGCKLMEHSYFGNPVLDAVANAILDTPTRLIWCGDYAEDEELRDLTAEEVNYKMVWGEMPKNPTLFKKVKFDYDGKYLVNHEKKEYISFSEYLNKSKILANDWKGDEPNPISLLTALGNGRGGGDYEGENMEYVGTWAWDTIEIVNQEPKGYQKIDLSFKECFILRMEEDSVLGAKDKGKQSA